MGKQKNVETAADEKITWKTHLLKHKFARHLVDETFSWQKQFIVTNIGKTIRKDCFQVKSKFIADLLCTTCMNIMILN